MGSASILEIDIKYRSNDINKSKSTNESVKCGQKQKMVDDNGNTRNSTEVCDKNKIVMDDVIEEKYIINFII